MNKKKTCLKQQRTDVLWLRNRNEVICCFEFLIFLLNKNLSSFFFKYKHDLLSQTSKVFCQTIWLFVVDMYK